MSYQTEISLDDLNQIALGAPFMTNFNVSLLHSLLDVLLKKLNCYDEKIIVDGIESRTIEELMKKSHATLLPMNNDNVEIVKEKITKIDDIETRLNVLENKWTCHLNAAQELRASSLDPANMFNVNELFASLLEDKQPEDLCTVCNDTTAAACTLLNDTDFLQKLMRRICVPVIKRLFVLEDKIEALNTEISAFIERAKEEYDKIAYIMSCLGELDRIEEQVQDNHLMFIATMEEVQEILDTKLDKIHIPALKMYIRNRMRRIESELQHIQAQSDCPRAAGIIMTGLQCLQCSNKKICADVGVQAVAMLPNIHLMDKQQKLLHAQEKQRRTKKLRNKFCGCKQIESLRVAQKFVNDSFKPVKVSVNKLITLQATQCRSTDQATFKQFVGYDGNLYRSG